MERLKKAMETFSGALRRSELAPDPIQQFRRWFQQALQTQPQTANVMTLATATAQGEPSARIVLLKAFDERGFVFFTNYESPKGRDLAENPRAALVFYWPTLKRQVRISGVVSRLSLEASERYFHSRPRGSQLSAWVSHQSEVIPNRRVLEERFERYRQAYEGREVPLPPYWGGFRVEPRWIEFWQERPNRLHDRFRYTRCLDGNWHIERLSP